MLKVLQTFFIALNTVLGTCSSYFKPLRITSPNVSAVLQHDMRTVLSSWAELRICCLMFLLLRVFTAQHRKQRSETFPGWFPRQSPPKTKPHSSLVTLRLGYSISPPQLFPRIANLYLNSLCFNTNTCSRPLGYSFPNSILPSTDLHLLSEVQ